MQRLDIPEEFAVKNWVSSWISMYYMSHLPVKESFIEKKVPSKKVKFILKILFPIILLYTFIR